MINKETLDNYSKEEKKKIQKKISCKYRCLATLRVYPEKYAAFDLGRLSRNSLYVKTYWMRIYKRSSEIKKIAHLYFSHLNMLK